MRKLTIVSGGQTGVDQAALDAARELGLAYGGFIPNGRWTEAGPLGPEYEGMVETNSPSPSRRTKLNVREPDATLIVTRGACEGGTLLTAVTAVKAGKPHLIVDLAEVGRDAAVALVGEWLDQVRPERLNVAGPRATKHRGLYREAKEILLRVLGSA